MCGRNESVCGVAPVWGSDLRQLLNCIHPSPHSRPPPSQHSHQGRSIWEASDSDEVCLGEIDENEGGTGFDGGYARCLTAHTAPDTSDALRGLVLTPTQRLHALRSVTDRFVFVIPPATALPPSLHTSHPRPWAVSRARACEGAVRGGLAPAVASLHHIDALQRVQFPDLRLIQYDCGKLQTLDTLLRGTQGRRDTGSSSSHR